MPQPLHAVPLRGEAVRTGSARGVVAMVVVVDDVLDPIAPCEVVANKRISSSRPRHANPARPVPPGSAGTQQTGKVHTEVRAARRPRAARSDHARLSAPVRAADTPRR
ncbi:hypothetical protein GCM10010392_53180 [Streptomyces clavifer]|nr:hypothetical protein GCM10010392_53180 [Streptomyces clavifer]